MTAVPPAGLAGLSSSVDTRTEWLVPVQQPLILISQIQRSGGTLVCRLFDDHHECFTHPYELLWGRPSKYDWPALDLGATPDAMFEALEENWVRKAVATIEQRIHRVFGDLQTWLRGTHRGVGRKYLQVYLDEFTLRFNRRRTPPAALQTLLGLGTQRGPTTYRQLYEVESTG